MCYFKYYLLMFNSCTKIAQIQSQIVNLCKQGL